MAAVWFDHIVIGAESLDAGAAWAERAIGSVPALGGAHPSMGTHNRLGRLDEGYLEIIAVDPAAAAPDHPRWYGLDAPEVRAAIAGEPRPVGWVLATDDIEAAAEAAPWDVGDIIAVRRDALHWRMATPTDGRLALGVLPLLIQWPAEIGGTAPRGAMVPLGLALTELRLASQDPSAVRSALAGCGALAALAAASVSLTLETADAPRIDAAFAAAVPAES